MRSHWADTTSPSGVSLGTGVRVVSTEKSYTQGNLLTTNNSLDVAIEGAKYTPIEGPDDQPLAVSVAELTTVELGGHEQSLMIRGVRDDAPVLLWLLVRANRTGISPRSG